MNGNVANILACYGQATAEEVRAGMNWYRTGRRECIARVGLSPEQSCGIVAALSPQTAWGRNLDMAETFARTGTAPTTTARRKVAARILRGTEPLIALGGNKVRAFYHCLLNPSNKHYVCVDGHAYSIWRGVRIPTSDTPRINSRLYHAISVDYRSAAKAVGILPNQLQAITWVAWRRIHDSPGRQYD